MAEEEGDEDTSPGEGFEETSLQKEYAKRVAELEREHQEEATRRVHEDFEIAQYHDTLIDICASAFGPEGPLQEETGYRFLFSEPLVERRVKNFDALIHDPAGPRSIFVECKAGISNPASVVNDAQQAYQEIEENKSYLEDQLGGELGYTEYVACFPSEFRERMVRHLENRDDAAFLDGDQGTPLLLWEVNKFRTQRLGLVTRIPNREDEENQHGEGSLTSRLSDTVEIDDAEVLYRCYPSSHNLRLSKEGLAYQMQANLADGRPLKTVCQEDLEAFFSNPEYVPHYETGQIGQMLAERVIDHGVRFGLIDDDDGLEINIDLAKMGSILARFEDRYLEAHAKAIAEDWAREEVREEFRGEYPKVDDFEPYQP